MATTSRLLAGATSASAPSQATDGVQIPAGTKQALLCLESTAGSGTMTATVRIWGYVPALGKWFPLGSGTGEATANTQGVLNGGSPIEEVSADKLLYCELIDHLDAIDRLAAEIVSLGGTGTAINLDAVWYPAMQRRA